MPAADTIFELSMARDRLIKRFRRARERACVDEANRLSYQACKIEEQIMEMMPASIPEAIVQLSILREHAAFDDLGRFDLPMFDIIITGLTKLAIVTDTRHEAGSGRRDRGP